MISRTFTSTISRPAPVSPVDYSIPMIGRYGILRDDYETRQFGMKPRAYTAGWSKVNNPGGHLPATIRTTATFYVMNQPWQVFQYNLFKKASGYRFSEDFYLNCWRKVTEDGRAEWDNHSWTDVKPADPSDPKLFEDFIQGLNKGSRYGPMAKQDLLFSGNMVKILGEDGRGNYIIETLDVTNIPPSIDAVWGKWWLVGWLTQSTIEKVGDGYRRIDWPYLGEYGVPYMVIGRGGRNIVSKEWVKPAINGAAWNPYYP